MSRAMTCPVQGRSSRLLLLEQAPGVVQDRLVHHGAVEGDDGGAALDWPRHAPPSILGVSITTACVRTPALANRTPKSSTPSISPLRPRTVLVKTATQDFTPEWMKEGAQLTIYIVLGILYESYIHPFTILTGLPSAVVGALLALRVFGMDLSLIAVIGLLMLMASSRRTPS